MRLSYLVADRMKPAGADNGADGLADDGGYTMHDGAGQE